MTRYRDIRTTHYKRTGDIPDRSEPTPRMLSPFTPDGIKLRPGISWADIMRPLPNRRSRRAAGQTRPRHRIGGVALTTKPWKKAA